MSVPFQLLSSKEEALLSKNEVYEYYQNLRRYILDRKSTNTTRGATFWGPKLKKITTKIAIAVTRMLSFKNVQWVWDGTENIPEGPAIFAHNHQGILDGFVWIPNLKRHCLILHGSEVNKILLLCQMNTGLILVKKEDRKNNLNAKLDMIHHLLNGHSITYFPEGTWNLSPNKLHLPLRYGFLDTARKANVPVIPVVHEYTYTTTKNKQVVTKIHSRYGKPIYITPEDDIMTKLQQYQDAISTMVYELIEEKGMFNRKEISNVEYITFLKKSYADLRLGRLDWDKERRNIFGADSDFYVFHHINDIPFDENGNFLETSETIRLNSLFNKRKLLF